MQLQQEIEEAAPDLEALRRRLQCRSADARREAEQDLARLKANQLIELMAVEKSHRSRRQKTMLAIVIGYLVFAITLTVFVHNSHMFNIFGSFTGVIAGAMAFTNAHKGAARALAQYDNPEGVSPLIEALEIPEKDVQNSVRESLTRILPRLKSSDAGLLTADARRILRKQLSARAKYSYTVNVDNFIEAALTALTQVGDESFIESVEGLAAGRGYRASNSVRIAANDCLPALRQRVENDRLSHNLLRASASTAAGSSEQLLRAVDSVGTADSAVLLRAATEADGEAT